MHVRKKGSQLPEGDELSPHQAYHQKHVIEAGITVCSVWRDLFSIFFLNLDSFKKFVGREPWQMTPTTT